MKKTQALLISFGIALLVTGCTITQQVKPVSELGTREVCLVQDPAVRAGFLRTYRDTLQGLGYAVKLLPPGSNLDACPVVSTYLGRWSWDLGLYMSYAEIKVYKNGTLTGSALYDSTKGGGNMNKFIKGDEKIRELVSQLFSAK